MTEANKILTVSYGTFSCTLEGFDDPFTTMKAIAEYFRDLAADDRYFGAEPPTPDAAMLHRIAEREVQRRVEAKISENGVTLRTGDAMEPVATPVEQAPRPQPVAPTLDAAVESDAEESVAARLLRLRRTTADAAPATTVVAATVAWASDEADSLYEDEHFDAVAASAYDNDAGPALEALTVDLMPDFSDAELSAEPVLTAAEVLAEPAVMEMPDEVSGSEIVDVVEDAIEDHAPEVEPVAAETQVVNGVLHPADDVTNIFADTFDPVDVIDHVANPSSAELPEPMPVAEHVAPVEMDVVEPVDVAAKDIVVAEAEADVKVVVEIEHTDPVENAAEDDLVEAQAAEITADDADLLQRLVLGREDSPRVDHDEALVAHSADTSALSEMIATLSGGGDDPAESLELAEAQYGDGADFASGEDLYHEDSQPEDEPPIAPELVEELAAAEAKDADDLPMMQPEAVAEAADPVMDAVDADPVLDDAEDSADPLEDIAAADADHVADAQDVAPAMVDADEEPDDLGDDANAGLLSKAQMARARVIKIRRPGTTERPIMLGDAGPMPPRADDAMANLSDAAEAELAAELAAADHDPETLEGDKDADVARLMRQADTVMAGPENRRRLSAIAHLKAAVAATIADRRVGRGKATAPEEQRIDPYRDDLARVVRPSDMPAPAPAMDRPGPLVLVSEQRIDRPKVVSTAPISAVASTPAPAPAPTPAAPVMPVRPRRIVAGSSAAVANPLVDAVAELEPEPELDDDDNFDDAAIFADPRSFSEFAERLGAEDLPSLLQAAAAYAMEVEEMPSFTRPQLLRQIEAHGEPGDFQREDVLRSFGQLLRTGDFIKKRRGQYALQDGATILTDARKIVGPI